VQKVYGHDYDTRHTDTTYGFHSNTGGDLYDFSKNTLPILTIWDGGGNDTLDVSGFTQNQVIDLRSGYFSDIGPLHDNITIAFDCDIENATGGTGNDVMIGNSLTNVLKGGAGNDSIKGAAGNDFLYGEIGQDKLDGGPGQDYLGGGLDNDTFVFTALSDSTVSAPDIIIDFRAGDRIDVSNIDANARVAGNQAFSFVKDFTGHAGELQWDSNGSDIFTITADVNGDKIPDFAVQVYHLSSMTQLTAADFYL
jgi:serralysin